MARRSRAECLFREAGHVFVTLSDPSGCSWRPVRNCPGAIAGTGYRGLHPAACRGDAGPSGCPLWNVTRHPGDGTGAFRTGRHRNLFTEQLGLTQAQTHARVAAIYHQLFHGDGQEQRLYFETGANEHGPLAYITDWANNDARSEGMSYGMMIAVQLGHKREFDALWNWSKTYMEVTDPANPSHGYFAWSMGTDGSPRSTGAAPDGEQYYAMALYFAANRWGTARASMTTALRPTVSCMACATAR
jgi:hypothetical protein